MDRNISNWGDGQIMELPNYLFGRRYAVGCAAVFTIPGTTFQISLQSLPEKCVIWELHVCCSSIVSTAGNVSLALGDQLPANPSAFARYEQLFPDIGVLDHPIRDIYYSSDTGLSLTRLRTLVHPGGRRLVCQITNLVATASYIDVILVVSSVPRSLPEWFG